MKTKDYIHNTCIFKIIKSLKIEYWWKWILKRFANDINSSGFSSFRIELGSLLVGSLRAGYGLQHARVGGCSATAPCALATSPEVRGPGSLAPWVPWSGLRASGGPGDSGSRRTKRGEN